MINKKMTALVTGALVAGSVQLAVAAKGPDYTYAEIDYINTDADDLEGDGFGVDISYGATDLIFLKFGYEHHLLDFTGGDANADMFLIGGGAHYGVTDTVDVFGAVSYVDRQITNIDLDAGVEDPLLDDEGSFSDDGYLAEIGVRALVSKGLELNANVSSLHLDGEDDTGYGVGVVYDIAKKFSLTGGYNHYDDSSEDSFTIGLRLGL